MSARKPGIGTRALAGFPRGNIKHGDVRKQAHTNALRAITLTVIALAMGTIAARENAKSYEQTTANAGIELGDPKANQRLKCLREAAHDAAIGPNSAFGNNWLHDPEHCDQTEIAALESDKNPLGASANARKRLFKSLGIDPSTETWELQTGDGAPDKFILTVNLPEESKRTEFEQD